MTDYRLASERRVKLALGRAYLAIGLAMFGVLLEFAYRLGWQTPLVAVATLLHYPPARLTFAG